LAILGSFFMPFVPFCGSMKRMSAIGRREVGGNIWLSLIPISQSILEHHINKFKAGGTVDTEADEAECRAARHILTLGPAAILGARRVVQSIVDADTAPAKPESYRQLLTTQLAADAKTRETQFDQNPGLWLRVHPNVRSLKTCY
jgi:hypothetical protein